MSCVPCPVQGCREGRGQVLYSECPVGCLRSAGSGAGWATVYLAMSNQMPLSVFQCLPPPGRGLLPPGLRWRWESGAISPGCCTNGGMVFGCCSHWWTESRKAGCPAVLRDVHTMECHFTCCKAGRYPADTHRELLQGLINH